MWNVVACSIWLYLQVIDVFGNWGDVRCDQAKRFVCEKVTSRNSFYDRTTINVAKESLKQYIYSKWADVIDKGAIDKIIDTENSKKCKENQSQKYFVYFTSIKIFDLRVLSKCLLCHIPHSGQNAILKILFCDLKVIKNNNFARV